MNDEAQERLQRELDRLGLQVGQKFRIDKEGDNIECFIEYGGMIYYHDNSSDRGVCPVEYSIIELEPEDITWREFIQPDWSEELLGWCKGWKVFWLTCEDGSVSFYNRKPLWVKEEKFWDINTLKDDYLNNLERNIKSNIISELNKYLKEGENGTIIQIIDGKPYLRQVIDGVIQER